MQADQELTFEDYAAGMSLYFKESASGPTRPPIPQFTAWLHDMHAHGFLDDFEDWWSRSKGDIDAWITARRCHDENGEAAP